MKEIEVKFLNVDPEQIQEKLKKIGAKKVGEFFYRRRVFDYPDWRLENAVSWLRLRDEGDRVTLVYKKRLGVKANDGSQSDEGMKEIEIEVNDYDKTGLLIESLGFIEKFYEENKRIKWVKGNVEFDIDTWPELETYLEIEADTWDSIDKAIEELDLNQEDKKIFSTHQIYRLVGINEHDYQRVAFDGMIKRK